MRNMTSIMANRDRLIPNTRFDSEDKLNIEILELFGRIRFVTIRSRMKTKMDKQSYRAIMVGILKYH